MGDLIERARAFALKAHEGQMRLGKGKLPLVTHIEEVALLVEESGGSEEEIAAGWLHDTVEDTPVLLSDITKNFGSEVGRIVFGLTDPPEFKGLSLSMRKAAQAERIRCMDRRVMRVKIADQTSNVRLLVTDPPVNWNSQKCLEYIEGARRIVFECQDVSEFLFGRFCEAYWAAIKAHQRKES